MAERKRSADMRLAGEAYCEDCPDREACWLGAPCYFVRDMNPEKTMATNERKPRKPPAVRRAIRAIMEEQGVKYTEALRIYEKRKNAED
jgi:hypothetical protein